MNHIYRIVWNRAAACYQVTAETAKGRTKSSKTSKSAVSGAIISLLSSPGLAAPAGGQVTAGIATISQSGSSTTINQSSAKAAIDWARFSVAPNESVRFNQPNANSITLNRVTGTERSAVIGSISANGQVFIINPNGVLFGAGSQVNVGSLTASTLTMENADFIAGHYKFAGDANGTVVNKGNITVAPGGTIALMAPVVENFGALSAPGGSVLLAGAQGVTLTLQADGGLVAYTLDIGSAQALVNNGGLIEAGGGHVVLTAKGVDSLSNVVVNHTGVIEAKTVSSKNGMIELLGDMQRSVLNVSGRLDASAPNGGDGGFIETSAAKVNIADTAIITTSAISGKTGQWLIDPTDFTIFAAGGNSSPLSGIAASTLNGILSVTNANIATSTTSTGNGDIFVNSPLDWSANKLTLTAHRNININANLKGSGTASLTMNYGQGTTDGAGNEYILANGAKITLPAGENFKTKEGSTGAVKSFTVITTLGSAGSTTGSDLQGIMGNLSGNYALGENINAAVTAGWNSGKGFQPIGTAGVNGYSGEFHGFGHVISNIAIDRTRELHVGMFGHASGKIQDVGVENANIIAGGLYGNVAGILAGDMAGSVLRSYTTGSLKSITSVGTAGGLIGTLGVQGLISQSYSSASVESSHAVGGLVGFFFGKIEDSYATGKVFNNSYAGGGLIGINNGEILRSYSTGGVLGTGSKGGLVGMQGRDRPATTTGSYWDKETSTLATSASGTGKTTSAMQQRATYAGWDFVNTWRIVEGNSYPLLRALTQGTITLDVTASSPRKSYDGNAIITLTDLQALPGGLSVTAGNTLANGDILPALNVAATGIWSGALNIDGPGNNWRGAKDAGAYTIVPSGLSSQKYDIAYKNGMLTIDPAKISIVGVSGSRIYDGTRLANWNDNTQLLGGVLPADQGKVSLVSGSGVLASKNAGTQPLASVGSLTLGGSAAGNYQLGTSGSSWEIRPANLVLSATADSKVYDSTTSATGSITQVGGRLFGTDSISGGVLAFADANAAPNKLVNISGVIMNDGNGGGNYTVTYQKELGIISPRPVGITAIKIYDGTRLANWNDDTRFLAGVLQSDLGNVSLISGVGALASKNAGTQPLISLGTFALGGTAAGNYQLGTAGSNWAIQPRPVSFTASQSYNGTTVADWRANAYSFVGILPADNGLVKMASGVAELPSPNVGTYLISSLGSLALGGTEAANYKLQADRSSWNITPANLLIAPSFTRETYYFGNTEATGSKVQFLEGQLFKDDTLLYGGIDFANGNAGINKIIKINASNYYHKILVDDNNFGKNYFLTVQNGRGDILPRPVDIVVNKHFDGNPNFSSAFEVHNKGYENVVVSGNATVSGTAGVFNEFKSYNLVSSNPNWTVNKIGNLKATIEIDFVNPIIGYVTKISQGINIDYVNGFGLDVNVTTDAIPIHQGDMIETFAGGGTIVFVDGSTLDLPVLSITELNNKSQSFVGIKYDQNDNRRAQERFDKEQRKEDLRIEAELDANLSIKDRIIKMWIRAFEIKSKGQISIGVRG